MPSELINLILTLSKTFKLTIFRATNNLYTNKENPHNQIIKFSTKNNSDPNVNQTIDYNEKFEIFNCNCINLILSFLF